MLDRFLTKDEISSNEDELAITIFKDKSESWLATRKWIHTNPEIARDTFVGLSNKDARFLDILHDPSLWFRYSQINLDKTDKNTTLVLCGRGFGKSFFSAFYAVEKALEKPNTRIAFWAADFGSLKRVNWMSDSGILKAIHPKILKKCTYNKSDLTLTFPNGSTILSYSAESYDKSRGDSVAYCILDELASWTYAEEALDAARLILRLGREPKMLITTTPRPTEVIRSLANDEDVNLVLGTTYDNYFLPESYAKELKKKLTERMFNQEVYGKVLDDNLYALFQMTNIIKNRVNISDFNYDSFKSIVIGIDPAVTSNENSDLTGIVVAGVSGDGEYYILEDASISMASPEQWSNKVVSLYREYNKNYSAPVNMVAEVNNGGDLITSVIRNASRNIKDIVLPPVRVVRATRGKELRAEPVAALYEQNIVHHIGEFMDLESQMTDWNPTDKSSKSPDRLDALVWSITSLSKGFSGNITSGYGTINSNTQSTNGNKYCGYY